MHSDPIDGDLVVVTEDEQRAMSVMRSAEAQSFVSDEYGLDLRRAYGDAEERAKIANAYMLSAMLDENSSRIERGAAADFLMKSAQHDMKREGSAKRKPETGGPRILPRALGEGLGGARESG